MKTIFILLFVLLTSIKTFGQEEALFSDNGYITFQNQEYFIFMALVNDYQKTVDAWKIPDVTPTIYETTTVRINEPISLFIVYAALEDSINLTYNFRILQPDGIISETKYDGLKISDTVISKGMLYPANMMPTIVFDENEDTGVYYFIIQVFDYNELIQTLILEFSLLE
jgi:hypothetical protein